MYKPHLLLLLLLLLGSNALEVWRQELQTKHQHSMPSINPIIDTWKCEKRDSGFIVNTKYTPLTSHNCSFISAKVKIDDVRPYSRKLLFTPFEKYVSCLSSCTISVPGNSTCVDCDITTLPHKSTPNSKTVRLFANKRIGRVTPMSEEMFIPIVAPVTQQSYDDSTDKQQFLSSFNRDSWPRDKHIEFEQLLCKYRNVFALSHHEEGCFNNTQHHIELTDNTPIRQKYRRIYPVNNLKA